MDKIELHCILAFFSFTEIVHQPKAHFKITLIRERFYILIILNPRLRVDFYKNIIN